jgi:hypothetical protein
MSMKRLMKEPGGQVIGVSSVMVTSFAVAVSSVVAVIAPANFVILILYVGY